MTQPLTAGLRPLASCLTLLALAGCPQVSDPANETSTQLTVTPAAHERPKAEFVPGQLIVKLKADAAQRSSTAAQSSSSRLESLQQRLPFRSSKQLVAASPAVIKRGTAMASASRSIERLHLLDIGNADVERAAKVAAAHPDVEYAEPNYIYTAQMVPNDPYYGSQGTWGQAYRDLWGAVAVNAEQAWDSSSGEGIVVAVVDSGVDLYHPDLSANLWTNPVERYNGQDDDNNGFIDDVNGWNFANNDSFPLDRAGHGTHVAGTIAAIGNNGRGVIGIAPRAKIMAVKGLDDNGSGTTASLVQALLYAARNGARVINNSWGGPGPSRAIFDAVTEAHALGAVVVVSAGNWNMDTNVICPARAPEAITVAALTPDWQKADFSNHGTKIDVLAPGVDVLSVLASGSSLASDPSMADKIVGDDYYRYVRLNGTSMAAPHVSGVAALVLAADPTLTNEQVRDVLKSTATPVDFPAWRLQLGSGVVNAAAAVAHVTSGQPSARTFVAFDTPAPRSLLRVWDSSATLTGSAKGPEAVRYTLELARNLPDSVPVFSQVSESTTPVSHGVLAQLTGRYEAGDYFLRLRAYDVNGRFNECLSRFQSDPTLKAGWPQQFANVYEWFNVERTPALADLDGDGQKEVVTTNDFAIHVFDAQGAARPGFPVALPYPPNAAPTVADIDGDGQEEIVVIVIAPRTEAPVYAYRADGTLQPGFPTGRLDLPEGASDVSTAVPAIATDVDGDGQLDVVAFLEAATSTQNYGVGVQYLYAFNGRGQTLSGWPKLVSTQPALYYTPFAAGDLDGDGKSEVVVKRWGPDGRGQLVLYPSVGAERVIVTSDDWSYIRRVVFVDPQQNGSRAILVVGKTWSDTNAVTLLAADGSTLPGWPVSAGSWSNDDPVSVADVDGDGDLEFLVGALTTLYGFHHDGSLVSGFPLPVPEGTWMYNEREVSVGYFANAPQGAFVLHGASADLRLIDFTNQVLPGWPKTIPFYGGAGQVAIGDLDGNGKVDIVQNNSSGGVYVWEEDAPNGQEVPSTWSTQHANNARSNAVLSFAKAYPQMNVRGTMNGWGTTPMRLVANNTWQVPIDVSQSTAAFKFDVYGDWSTNFGDGNQDGWAERSAADIAITGGPGEYRIRFNDSTMAYSATRLSGEGDWRRTVVFIYGVTDPGQDMFVRGGIDHGYAESVLGRVCTADNGLCAIPIRHLNLRNATTAPWKVGDTLLDWYGSQPGQSTESEGTPFDWTTNAWDPSWGPVRTVEVDGYGQTPLNTWGHHYWMLDVEMDCSKTVDGWFEVKSFISNGPGWESDVVQQGAPWVSRNHFARCGMVSTFRRNENGALFQPL